MFPGYVCFATQRRFSNIDTTIPTEARRERELLSAGLSVPLGNRRLTLGSYDSHRP